MKIGKNRVYEYTSFFEANEHGGYTVTVPSLPGLVTEGKDLEHARSMAKDAIQCYIEGPRKRNSLSRLNVKRRKSRFLSSRRKNLAVPPLREDVAPGYLEG